MGIMYYGRDLLCIMGVLKVVLLPKAIKPADEASSSCFIYFLSTIGEAVSRVLTLLDI